MLETLTGNGSAGDWQDVNLTDPVHVAVHAAQGVVADHAGLGLDPIFGTISFDTVPIVQPHSLEPPIPDSDRAWPEGRSRPD